MRPIDADALRERMYHEAFETDTDMQRWDSGCWIRYKLFENCLESMPTVSPDEVRGVGKWIHFTRKYISGVNDEGVPMIRCSVCDYTQFESSRSSTNYCPSCGAKMEVTSDAE